MKSKNFFLFLQSIFSKKKQSPLGSFKVERGLRLRRLGTPYGGRTFVDHGKLNKPTVISAGLGEDASFDIEFASLYQAKTIIIDPTPRAVLHFKDIEKNLGKPPSKCFSKTGKQPVEAYDLTRVRPEQLQLIEKALWNKSEQLRFFSPPNPEHVSHSILNYQNNYRDDTEFIKVTGIRLMDLLEELKIALDKIDLLKLDIEGAEVEVLHSCMKDGIKPNQILVEYDELFSCNEKGGERVLSAHLKLIENGYKVVHVEDRTNFVYFQRAE